MKGGTTSVMRVRVTRATDDNWYKVGEVHEVESKTIHRGGVDYYPLVEDRNVGVGPEHCEIIDEQPKAELTFPFKVRCINADSWEGTLEFGEVYTATGENGPTDYFIDDKGSFMKLRFEIVKEEPVHHPPLTEQNVKEEYTGGSVSYYSVPIDHPTDPEKDPYVAECNDVVENLDMSFAAGNILKAIWRYSAAKKFGAKKKGYDDPKYDLEKIIFFAQRLIEMEKNKDGK
jgi:hypothetical protein